MQIREYQTADIPQLAALWQSEFGDSQEYVRTFYSMLPDFGSCMVGVEGDRVIAMANALTGQELCYRDSAKTVVSGYIYAVAVDRDCRGKGYGREIIRAAYDLAVQREAGLVYIMPAQPSLFAFYEKNLPMSRILRRKKYEIASSDVEMTMKLNATEYNMMREQILKGTDYLRLSFFSADFLRVLTEEYGGGLFASMSGICVAEKDQDCCILTEVISQNPEATAASVANALGCSKAVYYLPSEEGEPYLLYDRDLIPPGTVWNVTYE